MWPYATDSERPSNDSLGLKIDSKKESLKIDTDFSKEDANIWIFAVRLNNFKVNISINSAK